MAERGHSSDDAETGALLDELASIREQIVVDELAVKQRYARRLVLFRRLTDKGVTQPRIAEAAGVTPMAVSYALGSARRREQPATT